MKFRREVRANKDWTGEGLESKAQDFVRNHFRITGGISILKFSKKNGPYPRTGKIKWNHVEEGSDHQI